MANSAFFKEAFDNLATDGCIGLPKGRLAYCYLRVSSAGQAEEGRSGLPRQIQHIHEIALRKGYRIPWEFVFADDHTGFEFKDRPSLSRLRKEYMSAKRRADAVVIEYLDRLSRNADWHQGFLLDEMKHAGLEVVFWKSFSSRIERAVMGAISQEGMEQSKQRMAEGNIFKARDGRVTARTPTYGYKLVDSRGREGESAKKDTHYAIKEREAQVVRRIFSKIAFENLSLRGLAVELEGKFAPPKKMSHWEPKLLYLMIRNPVYKGEYIAHRWQHIKVPPDSSTASISLIESNKLVSRKVERPPEEWIRVPVPAIVPAELWEIANRILDKNKSMGRRNAKEPYLLTGIVKCATCGRTYVGNRKTKKGKNGQEYILACYRCTSRSNRIPSVVKEIGCDQGQLSCRILDDAVWTVVYDVVTKPKVLMAALDREFRGEANEQFKQQIRFLEDKISEKDTEDEKLYKAYQAGVFDEYEYAARRRQLKEGKQKLEEELAKLHEKSMTVEKYEEKKAVILAMSQAARKTGITAQAPFEVKQGFIKMVVDKITINVREGWFKLDGIVRGKYPLQPDYEAEAEPYDEGASSKTRKRGVKSKTASIPMGTDSSRRRA